VLPHAPLTVESIKATLVERLPTRVRAAAVTAGLPDGSAWLLVEMAGETTIIADGFSCRTQIRQETGRRPLHLAQVLAAALPGP